MNPDDANRALGWTPSEFEKKLRDAEHHRDSLTANLKKVQSEEPLRDLSFNTTSLPKSTSLHPIETVRSAIAADNARPGSFPANLYTRSFIEEYKKANEGGPEGELSITGLYTESVKAIQIRRVGTHIDALVTAKIDEANAHNKFVTKTVSFFMTTDGHIDDFDMHMEGKEPGHPNATARQILKEAILAHKK